MKKDLVIGAFTGYNWDQVKYWANSLKMSGYKGDISVIVGNVTFETTNKLMENNINVIAFSKDEEKKMFTYESNMPIHTERFFHIWNFLKDRWRNYRYIITTDMKDVIFQNNPSEWLENNLGFKSIVVGSECLRYEDEPWGSENLQQGFGPYFYETFKDWEIYNVGVFAGTAEYMKDLCLHIFQMSINRPISIVEQAAFNALLHIKPYSDTVLVGYADSGWVSHLGTTMDPTKISKFRPKLLEPEPHWEDGSLLSYNNKKFCIIHQWDRLDQTHKDMLMEIYK